MLHVRDTVSRSAGGKEGGRVLLMPQDKTTQNTFVEIRTDLSIDVGACGMCWVCVQLYIEDLGLKYTSQAKVIHRQLRTSRTSTTPARPLSHPHSALLTHIANLPTYISFSYSRSFTGLGG